MGQNSHLYRAKPCVSTDIWYKIQTIPCFAIDSQTPPVLINVPNGDRMLVATGDDGRHCVMHVYSQGLATLDIQYGIFPVPNKDTISTMAYSKNKAIESHIQKLLGEKCQYTRCVPSAIKRGKVCPYFQHGDDTLYESEPLQLIEEVNSSWQNIKIYKTQENGNMLCLDDEIMITEADVIYTHTLLGVDRNVFTDKTVLILGGGDGGLLHELLKMSPKHVLMVEQIDVEVINVCRKHLPGVCGHSLDNLTGRNYTVLIDNCVDVLKELMDANQRFDYVINDLSEYLVGTDIGHDNDFNTSAKILESSINVLDHGGKYLSRGDSQCNTTAIESFIRDVTLNGLHYEKFTIDVPSFKEKYLFHPSRYKMYINHSIEKSY